MYLLQRYHDVEVTESGIWRIPKRLELNRLPASQGGEADLDDEQIGPQQGVADLPNGVVGQAALEDLDEVGAGEVANPESGVHGGVAAADEHGASRRQQSLRPHIDSRGRCRPGNLADGGSAALLSFLTGTR